MSIHDQLTPVLTDLADVLDRIDATAAQAPTPCSEYTVAELREHVLQWLTSFTVGMEDAGGKCPTDPVPVEGTGAGQVRQLADRFAATVDSQPEQLFIGPDGLPTQLALGMILGEYIVHGWDLATATGQPWQPDEQATSDSLEFMAGMLGPDERGEGKSFGKPVEVPQNASALDQLLGLTGRDPQWSAVPVS